MNDHREREAWASYWAATAQSSVGSGCLTHAADALEAAQSAAWRDFAGRLPRGARVLDLGTGNGTVLIRLLRLRPDLELRGVDSSPILPPVRSGIILCPSISIEQLPYPAESFDGLTSQFGYEYADTDRAASEVARVLKGGGLFQMIIHRRDSPVVAHNLGRRAALRWALSTGGWLDKARELVSAQTVRPISRLEEFRTAPQEARRLFPHQSVAAEIVTAIVLTLERGHGSPANRTADALTALEAKARNEIDRLDALDRAACDAERVASIVAALRSTGLQAELGPDLIDTKSNTPFAWLVSGWR